MPYSSFKNTAFQSTPSAWRETLDSLPRVGGAAISIHSLRMEGDRNCLDDAHEQIISIHSLRMEGDFSFPSAGRTAVHFNPLPPHGGRLPQCVCTSGFHAISIHSLRMEGDHRKNDNFAYSPDISIHSLRMEGDLILLISIHLYIISIHSLRE